MERARWSSRSRVRTAAVASRPIAADTTWASGSTWRRPPSRLTMPSEIRPRSGSARRSTGTPSAGRPPPGRRRTAGGPAGNGVRPPRPPRERTTPTPSVAATWWHLSASGSHDPRGTERSRETGARTPTRRGGLGGFLRRRALGPRAGALSHARGRARASGAGLGSGSVRDPPLTHPGARPPMATQDPVDWVTRAADDAIRHHERTGADGPVTCSSGISPSGPVHLGNLREFLMPHFVADELRRRGVPVRHLHVWDDYDRFRKVPHGVDPSYVEHIGRPLVAVPDPWGCHDSWSTHFKVPVLETFAALGARWRRSPRPSATGPASTATRCCAPYAIARTSTPCWRSTARRGSSPRRRAERRARPPGSGGDGRLGRERRPGRRRESAWATSRSRPTAATAAATRPR